MEQVTTNQVKEMIDQLAAMTAAASITPEIVASIFEKLRILNDQEREKVIKVATEYIEEIRETGVDAYKCRTRSGSNVQAELESIQSNANEDNGNSNRNSLSIEQKVNALILCVRSLIEGVVFHSGTPFVSPEALKTKLSLIMLASTNDNSQATSICGHAVCGHAICGV